MSTLQLLIIGNGFDLHCGLKSSYRDFFRRAILDTAGDKFGLKQLKAGVSGFWENLLIKYYEIYGDKDYEWCDIENIIKETLVSIFINSENYKCGICEYALDYIKENKNMSLEQGNQIENFLFLYCLNQISCLKKTQNHNNEKLNFQLCLHLLSELNKLEKLFCEYINANINSPYINCNYKLSAVNLLASLTNFTNRNYDDITQFANLLPNEIEKLRKVYILSFNYTVLIDILKTKYLYYYSNVHGTICGVNCNKDCISSRIIFGIDDSGIHDVDSEMRRFSKTYRKMKTEIEPKRILPPKDNAIEIKFYGHSLSEADHSYFQSIFDYYDLYSNNNVSLIFYYSKGYENYDAVYKLINKYGKTLNNKDQGNNLLHKLLLENRLKICIIHD